MTRQTFFEHPVAERQLGDDFFQLAVLRPQLLHLAAGGFAHRVATEPLLARLEEVLAPALVQVRSDPFLPAQLGDALLAS